MISSLCKFPISSDELGLLILKFLFTWFSINSCFKYHKIYLRTFNFNIETHSIWYVSGNISTGVISIKS